MELCVDNRISRASVDFESFSLCLYAYQKMANMKRRSVRVVKEIDSNTIVLDQLPKGAHVRIMSSSVSFCFCQFPGHVFCSKSLPKSRSDPKVSNGTKIGPRRSLVRAVERAQSGPRFQRFVMHIAVCNRCMHLGPASKSSLGSGDLYCARTTAIACLRTEVGSTQRFFGQAIGDCAKPYKS